MQAEKRTFLITTDIVNKKIKQVFKKENKDLLLERLGYIQIYDLSYMPKIDIIQIKINLDEVLCPEGFYLSRLWQLGQVIGLVLVKKNGA